MKFLHFEVDLAHAAAVRVELAGSEANVRVMDDHNFRQYRSGGGHRFFGGHYKRSPAVIPLPSGGHWHVGVDTGGFGGQVSASVSVV